MDKKAVFAEIKQVIADVIEDVNVDAIDEATTAEDVDGWDSIQHVRILMALERKFKFRFSTDEIEKLKCVGDIVAAVSRHVPST